VASGAGNRRRFHRNGGDQTIAWPGSGSDIQNTTVHVNDGAWHLSVGVKDAAAGRVHYIDGVNGATGPAGSALEQGTTPILIGNNPDSTGRSWNGEIDDIAIWNRALSEAGVLQIHKAGSALETLIPEPFKGILGACALSLLLIRKRKR